VDIQKGWVLLFIKGFRLDHRGGISFAKSPQGPCPWIKYGIEIIRVTRVKCKVCLFILCYGHHFSTAQVSCTGNQGYALRGSIVQAHLLV